ncbi:hypothetical protein M23134_02896 [Microscilla marina ATCC 23134]|uniref:DUF2911 domain-containing protein n=2 Tax=Microscilla marina TaxID=1027 RepID=A1ZPZ4_MICM2|nr:hypothetical protein M23134_02896 [Microscilla marina ATCC 23134]
MFVAKLIILKSTHRFFTMKRITLLITLFCLGGLFQAKAQLNIGLPAPSPQATLQQKVGLTDITVSYSRPGIKGRKIFGGIISYGRIWRTGANMATTIAFGDKVSIAGKEVPKGKYSLYTIPGKKEWTIILNKGIAWGTVYQEKNDLMRFKVAATQTKHTFESFTIDFSNFAPNAAHLNLMWENTVVSFKITSDVDAKVMASINRYMQNPERALTSLYFESATYYYNTNRDLDKALGWVNKAVTLAPSAYWIAHLKAKIQGKLKDYKGAIATAKTSIVKANKAGNPDYVRLNQKLISQWEKQLNK